MEVAREGLRSTPLLSNAKYVQSALPEPIICAPICVHIPTRGLSNVPSVIRLSRASTIASVTKVYIRAKRSLYVKVNFLLLVNNGAAAEDLRGQMLWVAISGRRQEESVSDLFWKRRIVNGNGSMLRQCRMQPKA